MRQTWQAVAKSVLITTQLAEKLLVMKIPSGRKVRMGELTFTVIGVSKNESKRWAIRHSGRVGADSV